MVLQPEYMLGHSANIVVDIVNLFRVPGLRLEGLGRANRITSLQNLITFSLHYGL